MEIVQKRQGVQEGLEEIQERKEQWLESSAGNCKFARVGGLQQ